VKSLLSLAAVIAVLLGISPNARAQTEVTLLAPNPFRRTLDKVVSGFGTKTGYKLKLTLGRGLGTKEQIARGEMFDVSILLPPYPEALASGNIDPKSATTLAKMDLALGVKKGAPKPDVSTVAALKKTLLAAGTIAYVDPTVGSDGAATKEALEKLGVLDQIASKTKIARTASASAKLVGMDQADLCIFYLNEMKPNPDVDVVAALPKQYAIPTPLVAFISTHVSDAKAAKALVDYLASPDVEAVYQSDGLEPPH
jgi:molybdate transport system substrate-binding protein